MTDERKWTEIFAMHMAKKSILECVIQTMLQQWIIYVTQFTDLFKNKPHQLNQLNSQPTATHWLSLSPSPSPSISPSPSPSPSPSQLPNGDK